MLYSFFLIIGLEYIEISFISVQSLSCVQLFVTPWTAACQASLTINNTWRLLKLQSFESLMPSSNLILCHPCLLCLLHWQVGSEPLAPLGKPLIGRVLCVSFSWATVRDWPSTIHWPSIHLVILLPLCLLFWFPCCSVTQSYPTLWNPMDCSTPGFPIHHQLLEFAQTSVYCVGDAIQQSHPLSPPSPLVFNPS